MKSTVRLNFEFPRKEYPYLKMICAEKGITFREFASKLILKEIEEYEDRVFAKRARKYGGPQCLDNFSCRTC